MLLRRRARLRAAGRRRALRLTPKSRGAPRGAGYYVDFIGFTPGLPYLSGLPEPLHIPRLEQPRVKTPPGSVSIEGHAVLHLLGGEPGRVLGAGADAGAALRSHSGGSLSSSRAGDHVRFRRIDRTEFDAITAEVAAGNYRPVD